MDSLVLFESVVYRKELPEHVDHLNKVTNDYLVKARKESKSVILEREKRYGVEIGDHGMSYHSHGKLYCSYASSYSLLLPAYQLHSKPCLSPPTHCAGVKLSSSQIPNSVPSHTPSSEPSHTGSETSCSKSSQ